jgi:hypothetical protein
MLGLALVPGCKNQAQEPSPKADEAASVSSASVKLASGASPSGTGSVCTYCMVRTSQIREDPEAGKRGWEQLRARQVRKEKTRPLRWDRRHMQEHKAVLAAIGQARERYDEAETKAAVENTRKSLSKTIPDIRRQVHEIDPWRNGSALLDDYKAILDILENRYPKVLLASLDNNKNELTAVRRDLDARLKKVRQWLEEAAKYKDEY